MWLEWIALTALFAFGALGAWRGTLATFLRIFGLALAYAAGVLAAALLGPWAARQTDVAPLIGTALAGAGAFAGTLVVLAPISWLLRRRERHQRGDAPRSGLDRVGGACFGLVQGTIVALLIGVLGNWLALARAPDRPDGAPARPTPLARATRTLIEGAADLALDPVRSGRRRVGRRAVRPTETFDQVRSRLERRELDELRDDALFWSYV